MEDFRELDINDLEAVAGVLDRSKLTPAELAHLEEQERDVERIREEHAARKASKGKVLAAMKVYATYKASLEKKYN